MPAMREDDKAAAAGVPDTAPLRAVRASAPARLDFAGGWTDVAPFTERERGVVVNAAIEIRATALVRPGGDRYLLHAEDLGERMELEDPDVPAGNGKLDLLRAGLRLSRLPPCAIHTRSEAPPGSGLGSSGALGVALVAALDAVRGWSRPPGEMAEEAFVLEAVEAALPGGRQDQYAAALGGFHRLTFTGGPAGVHPLAVDPAFLSELAARTVVCYTGTSRVSSWTIARVMGAYSRGAPHVVDALRRLAEIAERMAEALTGGDLAGVAELLSENWRQQQRLDPGMCTDSMARLEAALREAGVLGGKAAGAGAGGCMFFVSAGDRSVVEERARAVGAALVPFAWAREGVRVDSGA